MLLKTSDSTSAGIFRMNHFTIPCLIFFSIFLQCHTVVGTSSHCVIHLRNASGTITSPNYPRRYPSNYDCSWVIHALPGYRVSVTFLVFSLESDSVCAYDYVQIREYNATGVNLTSRLCGTTGRYVTASSYNSLWMVFKTDSSQEDFGFKAQYSQTVSSSECNVTMTEDAGMILSPNHPIKYPPNVLCTWIIPVAAGKLIRLSFLSFELEESVGCINDYVQIGENGTLGADLTERLCGRAGLNETVTSSSSLKVVFKTDDSIQLSGFKARYYLQSLSLLSPFSWTGGHSLVELTDSSGFITSPHYPSSYRSNDRRSWIIRASPGRGVHITFIFFSLEGGSACSHDYVQIREKNAQGVNITSRLCGTEGRSLTVKVNGSAYIVLKTDISVEDTGFKAQYSVSDVMISECVYSLTAAPGNLTSPYYPNSYPSDYQCSWHIIVPDGDSISFTVLDFQLESSYNCDQDYMQIREKTALGANLTTRLCGTDGRSVTVTSNSSLWIVFKTNGSGENRGFQAEYRLSGEVRLRNGRPNNEGTLEHRVFSAWVPVCGNGFDANVAAVVCRELGLYPHNATFSVGETSSSAADNRWYQCTGSEDRLAQCQTSNRPCTLHTVNITCNPPECGVVRGPDFQPVMVGGEDAAESQFPWMVMLLNNSNFVCGGTIIDSMHVVTAAHCIDDLETFFVMTGEDNTTIRYVNTSPLEIIAGKHEFSAIVKYDGEQRVRVLAAIYHNRFNLDAGKLSNDIAVLKLEHPLTFNTRVSALCLPKETSILPPQCTATGWGSLSGRTFLFPAGQNPDQLKTFTTSAFSRAACVALESRMDAWDKLRYDVNMSGILPLHSMCLSDATVGGKKLCHGDSGGPTFCLSDTDRRFELMGVAIMVIAGCGTMRAFPSVMTYVPPYLSWIRQALTHLASPCATHPCRSGSICRTQENSYKCDCSPGMSGPRCDICGQNLTLQQGSFTSVNYPFPYRNTMNCVWTIPINPGDSVVLTFLDIDIEYDSNKICMYDYVEVREVSAVGLLLAKLCGSVTPTPILSRKSLHVRFVSDTSRVHRGFKALYRVIGCSNYTFGENCRRQCLCNQNNSLNCDQLSGLCRCKVGWRGTTCNEDIDECKLISSQCTGRHELCRNIAGGFQCVCTDGTARSASDSCVETTTIPIQVAIIVDVDFDERNTVVTDSLSTQLQVYLVKKSYGILDVKIKNMSKGRILITAEVLVETPVTKNTVTALLEQLNSLNGVYLEVGQKSGRCWVTVAGLPVNYSTKPCDLMSKLDLRNIYYLHCQEQAFIRSTMQTVYRQTIQTHIGLNGLSGFIVIVCVLVGLFIASVLLFFCKKARSARGRRPGVSTISSGTHGTPVCRRVNSQHRSVFYTRSWPNAVDIRGYVRIGPSTPAPRI